jgi:carbamoyltransferase
METAYLGPGISHEDVEFALDSFALDGEFLEDVELVDKVSALLVSGAVIGWARGRQEWGPRALGARSILADPRAAGMRDRVNRLVKFREPFRPFAPSVLLHRAEEFFELPAPIAESTLERYMLSVCTVRQDAVKRIPAVTHVDGTARVHLVTESANPAFAALIGAFGDRTSVPVLLNTSFNLRGEPIVSSAHDALDTFVRCDIDALVIGNCLVVEK